MIGNTTDPAGSINETCQICGGTDITCVCPECDECGEVGNPECIQYLHMPLRSWFPSFKQMKAFLDANPEEKQYIDKTVLMIVESIGETL